MNQNEKKEVMEKFAKKLENAIKREIAVTKEIENDKALIKYLEAQKTAGAALDTTAYESYEYILTYFFSYFLFYMDRYTSIESFEKILSSYQK